MVASLPNPPLAEKTGGINVACSTFRILIHPLLLHFMFPIALLNGDVLVGGSMRVENPDVKE